MAVADGTVHQPFLYNATDQQLEEFLLLGLFVAGKNAVVQQHKLNWFLERIRNNVLRDREDWLPLRRIAFLPSETLERHLRFVGAGQYRRLVAALAWLGTNIYNGSLNLRTCSREELVECPGIGYKTASFFLIYTRPGCRYACLDTHILRWLREECGYTQCPKASPQDRRGYESWEAMFLHQAEQLRRDPTELDFELWLKYSKKK